MATIKAGTYRFNDVLTAPSGYVVVMGEPNELQPSDIIASTTLSDGEVFEVLNLQCIVFDESVLVYVPLGETQISPFGAYTADEGWLVDSLKTITIPTDSEVSAEFAEWFSANAAPVVEHTVSGVWKFKDVLTEPPDNMWREYINFTVNSVVAGAEIVSSCNAISFGRDAGEFVVDYDVVNDDSTTTPTNVYSSAVTEYYVKGWYTSYLGFQSKETLMAFGVTDEQASAFATSYGEGIKTIDFGTESQTVSAEFYSWLTANATQPMASVSHNGEEIASLFPGQTATLKCAGMKMATDVVVSVAEQKAVEAVEDYDGTITIV